MVRFGVQMVFSSKDSTITDEDIDRIIAKGEEATAELDAKMKKFTEDAIKFKMDDTADLYDFDDENDENKLDFKKIVSENWIEPPKRERKRNYSESEYFKQTMPESGPARPKEPRMTNCSLLLFTPDGNLKKQRLAKSTAATKPKAPAESEISISRLDIRVALITQAQKHLDSDSLYVEELDVGEGQPRTVNRRVCVLCNLKPATMRGIKSQAMVLAASNNDHTKVELVAPPQSAPVGERVKFLGFEGEPDDVLNPKKKIWETVQVDLHTDKELVACYKDVPFTTSPGVCTVSTIYDGSIR
ncbi:hypothetical protein F0562_003935 [Nyssa sinensis]|uniref:tRNA-binding domain-containing protein n=1 Tax=Nyssa sinensis TaxID=561372 RepID=A0A5J5BXY8_9ASTE|nr:hypothetical protein F0562_003935 [Nyssa sinensis]